MSAPEFVVIGHVVRDIVREGWRLGGTATFAAVQAQRLGLSAGIVTRAEPGLERDQALASIDVAGRPAARTTSFENIYERNRRRQRVPAQAEPVEAEDVPQDWRDAAIALIGPVCGETPPGLGALFPRSLVGLSAQGWLRSLDRQRRVRRRAWTGSPFWSNCRVLFVSNEDLGRRRDQLERWAHDVPIVALTRDRLGARVHESGRWRTIPAFPTHETDPTGAGDVFASAFLVRYHETNDTAEATRFASAAAACSVEGSGVEAVAGRDEIESRLRRHPEVVLR